MPARTDSPAPQPPPARDAADTLRPEGPPTPPAPTPDAVPKLPQSDRYEFQELIGVGGMGKVYKAFDRELKRLVALKFLREADAALERRFLQEAQAQARVDHQNVCKVYEVGRICDEPYIAMQYIEGKTLREATRELTLTILSKTPPEDPAPPRKHVATIPADAESVILKCLEKEPQRRYGSARELAEDLQRVIDGEPVKARPPGAFNRIVRKVRRNKALAAALVALALVLIAPRIYGLLDRGAPMVVAVADFDNQTGDDKLDGLSGMLITSLEQSRKLSVLTRSRMFDILRQEGRDARRIDEPLGREVAEKAGAQALLLATIRKFDDLFVIDLKILDPRTNEYIAAVKEEGRGKASVPPLIDKLSEAARRVLRDSAPPKPPAPVQAVTTGNLEAYQHYFKGEEAIA